jgi:apolipoprotein N-acyltransferase
VPGWFPNERRYDAWVRGIVKKTKTYNLVGAVTKENGKPLNSAFLLNPEGEVLGRYDKHHLVPFGEYIPFGKFMARWIPYLGKLGTFDPGDNDGLLNMGLVPISVSICYEAIFPGLIRHSVNKGAKLIVNITNDGWFLATAAPEQHYVTNIFRAIESGRPVVRGANTGISAVIDNRGRQIARSAIWDRTVLEGVVEIPQDEETFYNHTGPWFVFVCLLALIPLWKIFFSSIPSRSSS